MGIRQLGIVKEIVESAGMGISYTYEDLVFIEHNAFLLQFTDKGNEMLIHVNQEADGLAIQGDIARLKTEASTRKMIFREGIYYTVNQGDEENIHLEFVEL
jgi:sRNA-binding carbon storage regulator CsrA